MPYTLTTPRTFSVEKATSVSITRLRIIEYSVQIEPVISSSAIAALQSGTGPYFDEISRRYEFSGDSTTRILIASTAGTSRVSAALEKGIFDELARLGVIPTGTTG